MNLPKSESTEIAVLSVMLSDEDARASVAETIQSEDFTSKRNKTCFDTIVSMYTDGDAIDPVTFAEHLDSKGKLDEVGGVEFVSTLISSPYSVSSTEEYCNILVSKTKQRKLVTSAQEILSLASTTSYEEVDSVVDFAEQKIFEAAEDRASDRPVSISEVVDTAMASLDLRIAEENPMSPYRIGLRDVDDMTRGFQPGQLVILAARPAMGKTALALNSAVETSLHQKMPSYIFELEMDRESLVERMISSRSRVPHEKLRKGLMDEQDSKRVAKAASEIKSSNIFIDDNPSLTPVQLKSKARRLVREHGPGLIIVDYLQLMETGGKIESRQVEVSKISRQMKVIARELNCPVLCLSQLSRGPENRDDKRPRLADLRDSGGIEQDADIVLFIYRPEIYYGTKTLKGDDLEGKAEVIIGKQRNGAIGINKCYYNKKILLFQNSKFS